MRNPDRFWGSAACNIDWFRTYDSVSSPGMVPGHLDWFKGGTLNTCFNAVDRHVLAGRGNSSALIYDSTLVNPDCPHIDTYSYSRLQKEVEYLSATLKSHGICKGDRVLLYMPMIPQAVIAMLATARIGAVHSVVFGGFAPRELAKRIADAKPKAILTATFGLEPSKLIPYIPLLSDALSLSHHIPDLCLVYKRELPKSFTKCYEVDDLAKRVKNGVDWQDAVDDAKRNYVHVPCAEVNSTDPLYLLYTSGTTGIPKGVVRDTGGHAVALQWAMSNIYDILPGQTFFAASDIGWVVGHSFIVYGPLFNGCTTVLYEGKPVKTPDASSFWRVVSDYRVKTMFAAPTAMRAIRKEDPDLKLLANYDVSCLKHVFLAGERCDPDTLNWMKCRFNSVIDHWWQTETGWPIASLTPGLDTDIVEPKIGASGRAVPGFNVQVLGAKSTGLGDLVIKLPLPPGNLTSIWGSHERFTDAYLSKYPGYYNTGDAGFIDAKGFVFVLSRVDDIINVAGHRLSTGGIEQVVAEHPDVAECAVISLNDAIKGEVPVAFYVLNDSTLKKESHVSSEIKRMVRESIGAIASLKCTYQVSRLPKTRSGKVLRATLRLMVNGTDYPIPPTIEDPDVLGEIMEVLKKSRTRAV